MRLYWLLLILPFLVLSVMDAKKAWNKIKEARRNPEARTAILILGITVYGLIVCVILMFLMMFGVIE